MTDQQIVSRYKNVSIEIEIAAKNAGRKRDEVQLVAVSKTYFEDSILPILEAGHRVFGENRIQESMQKWPALKEKFPDIELRLIGPLQSNKAAQAVSLFDVIESVDREKIAKTLAAEMEKQNRKLPVYIQVNTGLEEQKAGIVPDHVGQFVDKCQTEFGLNVVGLMCIPPASENPGPHFALLKKIADECNLSKVSMGMSADFAIGIAFGATSVRVGSAIFGQRK